MANYANILAEIAAAIYSNGAEEITGDVLQQVLLDMVETLGDGYQFKGVATPSTNHGLPDGKIFYLAPAGSYTNFGAPAGTPHVVPYGNLGVFLFDTVWHLSLLTLSVDVQVAEKVDGDFGISDPNGHEIVSFEDGHIRTKNFNSKDAAISIGDNADYDFGVCDPLGHFIAGFRNGHVVTKNFDSELIDSYVYAVKKFKGKKVSIIGDSISTYAGWLPSDVPGYSGSAYEAYYPHGDVNSVTKTWWYQMAQILGISPGDINTCSWGGSRVTGDSEATTTAFAGCSDRRITDLQVRGYEPDIVLVFISCNDWGQNVPVGTWSVDSALPAEGTITTMREAYALMLSKIHAALPYARVFCCTILDDYRRDATSGWPSNNGNGVSTYAWNQNIIEIAHALGCDVIDMHECGLNYSNIAANAVDTGLHPNTKGMSMMAKKVAAELIAKY